MSTVYSLEELANSVQAWCQENGVVPANGQAAETLTERTIRYYRTIGLLDPPMGGYVKTFTEKHRLQLLAIRLYQALGLPLRKIREELYGQSEAQLSEIVRRPARRESAVVRDFAPSSVAEQWTVTPLTEEFLLVSRQGRTLPPELMRKLRETLEGSRSTEDAGRN